MRNKWCWLVGMLFFFPLLAQAESAKITAIKLLATESGSRIIITVDQATAHHAFTLSHPNRLAVDFQKTSLAMKVKNIPTENTGVTAIRSGHPTSSILRIVFDLAATARVKMIPSGQENQFMVELILPAKKIKPKAVVTEKVALPETHPVVVVIDPGHGGKDSGAMGVQGTKEKNVVLGIAQQLAQIINQQPHMRAVLTRNGDYFVPLRGRLQKARKGNADLFVAIHADSFLEGHSRGASVYALSQRGATSEAARWLAQRDNYSELDDVDLKELNDQSYMVRSVLIDLAQTVTITDSLHLGATILNALGDVTKLHYFYVEQAPFVVLKSPDIPSVLVEVGFLSNADEELQLRDKNYQAKIAQALFEGVRVYIKKYASIGV